MNKGSPHTNTNLNAIPSGIFNRFTKLTSMTDKPTQMKIDERYPRHSNVLIKAGFASKVFM